MTRHEVTWGSPTSIRTFKGHALSQVILKELRRWKTKLKSTQTLLDLSPRSPWHPPREREKHTSSPCLCSWTTEVTPNNRKKIPKIPYAPPTKRASTNHDSSRVLLAWNAPPPSSKWYGSDKKESDKRRIGVTADTFSAYRPFLVYFLFLLFLFRRALAFPLSRFPLVSTVPPARYRFPFFFFSLPRFRRSFFLFRNLMAGSSSSSSCFNLFLFF